MKKYFMLFLLFLIFGAAKAQAVKTPYMSVNHSVFANFTNDNDDYGDIDYDPGSSSGEFTHTDGFGTTIDVSWGYS